MGVIPQYLCDPKESIALQLHTDLSLGMFTPNIACMRVEAL